MDEIIDRLPFRPRTLRKWAKKPIISCFRRVHTGPCGNSVLLVHVSRLVIRFEELADLAREEDARCGAKADPTMNDISGLHEFAELAFSKGDGHDSLSVRI